MATIRIPTQHAPTEINRFLGQNDTSDGELGLQLGEATLCRNYRITQNYKLKKREGFDTVISGLTGNVQGMWYGKLGGVNYFLFCNAGRLYASRSISGTIYNSLDTSNTNVDVIKTTAFAAAVAGTTGIDGFTYLLNSAGTQLVEVAQASIDNLTSIGKYYYHTDKTLWLIVAKDAYANIAAARTGLGTSTCYYNVGTLTDAPTSFIPFGTKVYLLNGAEYKSFDGTSFIVVAGYRPRVYINAPPAGGGTAYELLNELNGLKEGTFTPDNATAAYKLSSTAVTSVDYVYVNEVLKTVTTDYTVNTSTATVTFNVAPAGTLAGSVRIGWTQGSGNRAAVEKCRFAMDYSGQTDSRVFIWGDTTNKSRRRWSGLAGGIPSAEYFESTSYDDIGTGQYAITDIIKQYSMQKIFLEDGTRWSEYSPLTDSNGVVTASFPVYELNDEIGNVAFGQTQIVNNSPYSLFSGVHAWNGSNVREQTNETLISDRVQTTLTAVDLKLAKTVVWHMAKEYWCNIGSVVWIYNYLNNTWYTFDNISATCFLVVNDVLYFGTSGTIEVFDTTKRSDNGTAIAAVWEMGFFDGGAEWQLKFMNGVWISINPDTKVSADIKYVTDNEGTSASQTISYNLLDFTHLDFAHLSFLTSYNPQPFYLDIEAQQFVYIKFIITNSSLTDNLTVLSINLPMRYGGKVS